MQIRIRNQYLKKLIILDEISKDDDNFSGIDDNFSFKDTIFLKKYKRVGLLKDAYIQDVFIILLDYF